MDDRTLLGEMVVIDKIGGLIYSSLSSCIRKFEKGVTIVVFKKLTSKTSFSLTFDPAL